MVRLNHAIAAAMVHGAAPGLELLDAPAADTRLVEHHRLDAVRAHLLELAGDRADAARHYRTAGAKTGNLADSPIFSCRPRGWPMTASRTHERLHHWPLRFCLTSRVGASTPANSALGLSKGGKPV